MPFKQFRIIHGQRDTIMNHCHSQIWNLECFMDNEKSNHESQFLRLLQFRKLHEQCNIHVWITASLKWEFWSVSWVGRHWTVSTATRQLLTTLQRGLLESGEGKNTRKWWRDWRSGVGIDRMGSPGSWPLLRAKVGDGPALAGLNFSLNLKRSWGGNRFVWNPGSYFNFHLKSGQYESTTWLQYQYQTLMIRSFSFSNVALSGSASVGTPHLA